MIFSADAPYGQIAIKAKQKGSKNFGFSRELMDYTFNYELPYDKWVNIELVSEFDKDKSSLKQNYLLMEKKLVVKQSEQMVLVLWIKQQVNSKIYIHLKIHHHSLSPLQYIGDGKNAFSGMITDIEHNSLRNKSINPLKSELDKILLNPKYIKKDKLTSDDLVFENIDKSKYNITSEIKQINKNKAIINVTISDKNHPDTFINKNIILNLEDKANIIEVPKPNKPKKPDDNKKSKEKKPIQMSNASYNIAITFAIIFGIATGILLSIIGFMKRKYHKLNKNK
ncbi:hypothetical protein [Mycoplasmopsis cynos]|uniref:hypothetical protein n=1 Tax=Mycoplasmopsis cynos TaxID=171284 RepID=UPI0024C6FFCF|nr:hypothetical protein [Mycoplasmopsis cynos]WAM07466.1 hypothetical protein ONA21_04845 [Mycoplasmopsis cynos]